MPRVRVLCLNDNITSAVHNLPKMDGSDARRVQWAMGYVSVATFGVFVRYKQHNT